MGKILKALGLATGVLVLIPPLRHHFDQKIYKNARGGHEFNRIDARLARESRAEVYRFLAKHLSPPSPAK